MRASRPACIDVVSLEFRTFDAGSHWKDELDEAGVAAEEAAQAKAWQRGLWVRFLASPVVWVKRWRTARQVRVAKASQVGPSPERLAELLADGGAFEVQSGRLVSARHGCSLALPDEAEVHDVDRVAWRPSLVFVLHLGAFRVQCTAHDAESIRALADKGIAGRHAQIVSDETLDAAGAPARVLRVQVPAVDDRGRETGTHRRWVALVAGPDAVLKFEASDHDPEDQTFDDRFREVVASVRFEAG